MALTESPQSAYACVCLVSEDTQATMPKMIARPRALLDGSLYSFVQPAGQFHGSSQKGGVYASRCICFLPDYFEELDAQWPGTFTGMFERFADPWDEEESRAIMTTLLGTGPQHAPGFGLLLRARVEQMIATLAAAESRKRTARQHLATRKADGLALEAQMAIERMIDEGRALQQWVKSRKGFFVSRSHLCAQFDKETGQASATTQKRVALNGRKRCSRTANRSVSSQPGSGGLDARRFRRRSSKQRASPLLNGATSSATLSWA